MIGQILQSSVCFQPPVSQLFPCKTLAVNTILINTGNCPIKERYKVTDASAKSYREWLGIRQRWTGPDQRVKALDWARSTSSDLSDEAWDWAISSYQDCKSSHAYCISEPRDYSWFPTRLIDLGSLDGSSSIRLIETKDVVPQGPYATLSYCWGPNVVPHLESRNWNTFLSSIPVLELPKTLRDAIQVTRRLGLRYLWIDSVCIIQDSMSDWERESSQMGSIYSNSMCTISAMASTDSSGGLFFERNPHLAQPCSINSQWEGQHPEKYSIVDYHLWDSCITAAPLSSRAWAVQERLLAARVLHFGGEQLFWECSELTACESCPEGISEHLKIPYARAGERDFASKIWKLFFTPLPTSYRDFEMSTEGKGLAYDVWRTTIRRYSRAKLTKETDKLVAISGLAKAIRSLLHDTYLAGLWQNSIEWDICWSVESQSEGSEICPSRPSKYRAPSWSWASIDGEISYKQSYASDKHTLLLAVYHASVTSLTDDDTGQVVDGHLSVCGMLRRVTQRSDGLYLNGERVDENLVSSLQLWLDCESPASDGYYFVLPHHLDEDGHLEGLTLECVDASLGCYRRCGRARMNSSRRTKDDHGPDAVGDFKELYYDPEIPCEDYVEGEGYIFTLL